MRRILLVDNYDSFTYNLQDYFEQLGTDCHVVRNDDIHPREIPDHSIDALILSPGPMKPTDTTHLMQWITAFEGRVPVLGICLGHQALGIHYGAELVLADAPQHGKTTLVDHQQHPLFANIPSPFTAMRYHSLILEKVTSPMHVIAQTNSGEIMAIAHRELPIAGIQFHPESILTDEGLTMLENFLEWVKRPA